MSGGDTADFNLFLVCVGSLDIFEESSKRS